ncbi:MAG: endonuclease [Candidatus Woesearchaeota archaeon]|nr:endonuclease [Candidatus Woesearchaeota archaeon]
MSNENQKKQPVDNDVIDEIIKILEKSILKYQLPIVTQIRIKTNKPFVVLISTMLSLRTKDKITKEATMRLLELGDSPEKLLKFSQEKIEKAIYPVGFYKTKARNILKTSQILKEKYNGEVPKDMNGLLELPGVGRKTANLVLGEAFNIPSICVDTHVHRISNRLGYVSTYNPNETEFALREKLPQKYWIRYNTLLVTLGQNICLPRSPLCSKCPIEKYCPKIGVKKADNKNSSLSII